MRKHKSKGFSLAEVLVTVAILIILFAIAVPNLIGLRDNLNTKANDEAARDIYMASQNQLTIRKAAGTVDTIVSTKSGNEYWVISHGTNGLLPAGSVDAEYFNNYYAVCYDKETASALKTFYWSGTTHTVSELQSYASSESLRKEDGVGYYSGAGSTVSDHTIVSLPSPTVTVYEENNVLKYKVTVPQNLQITGTATVTVTVTELGQSGKATVNSVSFTPATITPAGSDANRTVSGTLDSLTGSQFKTLCSTLTPGANIEVKATVSKASASNTVYSSSTGKVIVNSLYASASYDSTKGGYVVEVATARQLQNLDASFAGLKDAAKIVGAVQTADIDWPSGTYLVPIVNANLASYDGSGDKISNLNVDTNNKINSTSVHAGLFATRPSGSVTENVRLYNPTVKAKTGTNAGAGALAGYSTNATFRNCVVYTDSTHKSCGVSGSANYAGGLVGDLHNGKIENCSVSLPTVSGLTNAGGLAGRVTCERATTVSGSYANTGYLSGSDSWSGGVVASASGSASGGFIGKIDLDASTCAISNSYACGYVKTGSTKANFNGTVSGTSSKLTIKNSYTVAKVGTDLSPCYWNNSGTKKSTTLSDIKDAKAKLTGFTFGSVWTSNDKGAKAYTSNVKEPYPYPAVTFASAGASVSLVHYGDWPASSVCDIKLYRDASGDVTVNYLLMTPNSEMTVYPTALLSTSPEQAANIAVEAVKANAACLSSASAGTLSASGRTPLTVRSGSEPGVSYVTLTCDGIEMRLIVIVHDRKVTLTPKNNNNSMNTSSNVKNASSAYGSTDAVVGLLKLKPTAKTGSVTAALSSWYSTTTKQLTKSAFETQVNAAINVTGSVKCSLPAGTASTVGTKAWLIANWDNFVSGDPRISQNGGNVLESSTSSNKVLAVTGKNSGTALVDARWAIDETVSATCEVKMGGARALIYSVKDNTTNVTKSNYPYLFETESIPGRNVSLTFTSELFNPPVNQRINNCYSWKVYRTLPGRAEESSPVATGTSTFNNTGNKRDTVTITLSDNSVAEASYRVVLTFTYTSGGVTQTSSDEMSVKVFRRASRSETKYNQINVLVHDYNDNPYEYDPAPTYGASGYSYYTPYNRNTTLHVAKVEQVSGAGTTFEGCNEVSLAAYIASTGNHETIWYVSTAGSLGSAPTLPGNSGWTQITGVRSDIIVYNGNQPRAVVRWNYNESDVSVNNVTYDTGGSITVTGLDVNDFGSKDFVFYLKVQASDVIDGNGDASYKVIEVHVKPQMTLNAQSYSTVVLGGRGSHTFTSNRSDSQQTGWSYNWNVDQKDSNMSLSGSGNSATASCTSTHSDPLSIYFTHTYGPYSSSAVYTAKGVFGDISMSINADYTATNGTDYFFLENNTSQSRFLEFTWGSTWYRSLTDFSSDSAYIATSSASGDTSGRHQSGSIQYTVSGKALTRKLVSGNYQDVYSNLKWTLSKGYVTAYGITSLGGSESYTAKVGVYGLDVKQTNINGASVSEVNLDLGSNKTTTLYADAYFPSMYETNANNRLYTSATVTWKSSDPTLVSVSSETGSTTVLTAREYTASGYYVVLTCTFTVQGKDGNTYRCVKNIPVHVNQTGHLSFNVQAASLSDKATLENLFEVDLSNQNWLGEKIDGTWQLIENYTSAANQDTAAFRADRMFLKITGSVGSNPITDFRQYYRNIFSDEYFVHVENAVDPNNTNIIYVMIAAVPGSARSDALPLTLTLDIGTSDGETAPTETILYRKHPTVRVWQNTATNIITNGSTPVAYASVESAFAANGSVTYGTFGGTIVPNLTGSNDSAVLYLSAPEGYNISDYATLTNGVVTLKTVGGSVMIPEFRMMINARSALSLDASAASGYALVFLPELEN